MPVLSVEVVNRNETKTTWANVIPPQITDAAMHSAFPIHIVGYQIVDGIEVSTLKQGATSIGWIL